MWKHFYSLDSAGEHGTLYQLRNLLNRSNVVEKPSRDFNACEDFLFLIVHSQVIMTALTTLKMKSLNDAPAHDTLLGPNPLSIWMLDVEERKKILDEVCSELVTRFVQFSYNQGCTTEVDGVFAYAKRLLSMGCFFLEYHDAIKEGDGLRVTLLALLTSHILGYRSNELFQGNIEYALPTGHSLTSPLFSVIVV